MSDLLTALNGISKAAPGYRKAHRYAEGTVSEVFATDELAAKLKATAVHFKINLARRVIAAVADRMEIASVTVAGERDTDEDGEEQTQPLTQVLTEQVWRASELDQEMPGWLWKLLEYGDAYLVVWPAADSEIVGDGDNAKVPGVDVFCHSPVNMRAFYSEENPRAIEFVAKAWEAKTKHIRVDLYYDGRIERFQSLRPLGENGQWPEQDTDFEPFTDDEQGDEHGTIEHPWGMCVFHARTSRPYGRPEHFDAYGPQNILTKFVAVQLSGVESYSWPWRAALSKAGTTGPDLSDWDDETTGVTPARTGPKRDKELTGGPGRFAKLHNTDSVVQLDASPASNFLEPINLYTRLMATVTATPLDQLNPTGNVETGESRRARNEPATKKAEKREAAADQPLRGALELAMRMLGHPDVTVEVTWAPTQSNDDKEAWEVVAAKQLSGVPRRQALVEAGFAPETVDAWLDSVEDEDIAGKIELLKAFVETLQTLGSAQNLGVVSEEQVAALVESFLSDLGAGDAPGPVGDQVVPDVPQVPGVPQLPAAVAQ